MIHKDFEGHNREQREADRKLFAKAIKTTLDEFKNHVNNKKWLLVFSTQVPCVTEEQHDPSPNFNLQAASKLGKINVNVMFIIHQATFTGVE